MESEEVVNFRFDRQGIMVDQNQIKFCEGEHVLFTCALGPCIAISIAWRQWAGMLHSADITMDEENVEQLIAAATKNIPKRILSRVQPILCGADTEDPYEVEKNSDKQRRWILRTRRIALSLLKGTGFGAPIVRWNEPNETTDIYANLRQRRIYLTDHPATRVIAEWPICTDSV